MAKEPIRTMWDEFQVQDLLQRFESPVKPSSPPERFVEEDIEADVIEMLLTMPKQEKEELYSLLAKDHVNITSPEAVRRYLTENAMMLNDSDNEAFKKAKAKKRQFNKQIRSNLP